MPEATNNKFLFTPCSNCKGTGVLIIYNAYDPSYKEGVVCEVCNGAGFTLSKPAENFN